MVCAGQSQTTYRPLCCRVFSRQGRRPQTRAGWCAGSKQLPMLLTQLSVARNVKTCSLIEGCFTWELLIGVKLMTWATCAARAAAGLLDILAWVSVSFLGWRSGSVKTLRLIHAAQKGKIALSVWSLRWRSGLVRTLWLWFLLVSSNRPSLHLFSDTSSWILGPSVWFQ